MLKSLLKLKSDQSGGMAIIASLSSLVLMGAAGGAIDFMARNDKVTHFQAAADASALAAIAFANENSSLPDGSIKAQGAVAAMKLWKSNLAATDLAIIKKPKITLSKVGTAWNAAVDFDGDMPTGFMSILGVSYLRLEGKAVAGTGKTSSVPKNWEFHLVVDTSASMGIGATVAEMAAMAADPQIGCAFACHWAGGASTFTIAQSKGYKVRINVVEQAMDAVLREIDRHPEIAPSAALHEIAGDLKTLVPMTTKINSLRNYDVTLRPYTSHHDVDTNYPETFPALTSIVGTTGDGSTKAKPKKAVYIMTDGVQNTSVPVANTIAFMGNNNTAPIDPAVCQSMKDSGILVGVLHVSYFIPAMYEPYVQPFEASITPNLQACASPGMYYNANDLPAMKAAMSGMLESTLTGTSQDVVRLVQ